MRTIFAMLFLAFPSSKAADVTATMKDGEITFRSGDEIITVYKYAGTVPNEKGTGTMPLAKPYFWPVNIPGGIPVTRAWPMNRGIRGESTDHFHQKSAWVGHGDVIPHGLQLKTRTMDRQIKGVDFWTENEGHGRIVCTSTRTVKEGDGSITLFCVNEWRSADGVAILKDRQEISISAEADGYRLAFTIVLSPISTHITFGDTKEGTFAVRVADELNLRLAGRSVVTSSDGKLATAPAKDDLPIWGQVAKWHDCSGSVNGKDVGIAVFAHPKNEIASAWHTRAYGLLAANPFGRELSKFPSMKGRTEPVTLELGKTLSLRYAIYAHSGDVKTGKVAEVYRKWSESK